MSEEIKNVIKSYKYRIYPTKKQAELIDKTFGCCRYVYNMYLNKRIEIYESEKRTFKYKECSKDLTIQKKSLTWLNEVDSSALQNTLRHLDESYEDFFKKKSGFPKFKSKKKSRKSYTTEWNNNNIEYLGNYIKLPKLKKVKTKTKLIPKGKIMKATISKEPSGKYYVSLTCKNVPMKDFIKTNNNVGIDLGISEFLTMNNGKVIENPKYYRKLEKKLIKAQQELSRKKKGSNNYDKSRKKLAKIHEKIRNQRIDFINKTSTQIIKDYDIICIEDLQPKNMLKNHNLAKSISDVSWSEFTRQLKYKAEWYGKKISKVDKFYPSSQICHSCGHKNIGTKDLKVREWTCPCCGIHNLRDVNAAINILTEGIKLINNN